MAKPSYQRLENHLLKGARYDLFSVFLVHCNIQNLRNKTQQNIEALGVTEYQNK